MMKPFTPETAPRPGRTLVVQVRDAIRAQITGGLYNPGDRMPSEALLTREYGVSRTVIREAIASLRSDGLVEPRQGAGVFVLDPPGVEAMPFRNVDLARVSSLIEMLELRTAVEGDAAAFAAQRRSPVQEEKIIDAFEAFCTTAAAGEPTSDADFAFHMAIAEATNNPRFAEFLQMLGAGLIPRRAVSEGEEPALTAAAQNLLRLEHEAILSAIQDGNEDQARAAMRSHLRNSQARYRTLLRLPRPPI